MHHQSGSQTPPNTIWEACPLPHFLLGKPPTGELDYRLAGWFPGLTSRTQRTYTLGQRAFAQMVGISLTYVSKIENHRLDFGDYPSTDVILRIAAALEADEDELLILAKKIPERIRQRVLERPDAFSRLAELDDKTLDRVLRGLEM